MQNVIQVNGQRKHKAEKLLPHILSHIPTRPDGPSITGSFHSKKNYSLSNYAMIHVETAAWRLQTLSYTSEKYKKAISND